jgi:hypothetical protein
MMKMLKSKEVENEKFESESLHVVRSPSGAVCVCPACGRFQPVTGLLCVSCCGKAVEAAQRTEAQRIEQEGVRAAKGRWNKPIRLAQLWSLTKHLAPFILLGYICGSLLGVLFRFVGSLF